MYVSVRGRTRRKKAASFGAEDELMGVCRARANTRGQTAPSTTATGKTIKSMAAASMCMETAIPTRSALCPRLLVCVHAGACVSEPRCGSCLPSDGGMFACTHQSHQSHARAHLMGGTRLNVLVTLGRGGIRAMPCRVCSNPLPRVRSRVRGCGHAGRDARWAQARVGNVCGS